MFESLSDKLHDVFRKLRGQSTLTESNIADAMREIRLALLDADVNLIVVAEFIEAVKTECVGQDVVKSVTPGQQVVKIVNEELTAVLGAGVDRPLNFAKNPAGFNQNISAVMQDTNPKDVIIAINDNAQDGIDISWLWDVDFDRLGEESIRSVTVSGIRCQDMRLRLKYVDIPSILESDVEKAIRDRVADGTGNLYVLVNYTALFSTRNILKKLEGEH